jgi:hypothetical protein
MSPVRYELDFYIPETAVFIVTAVKWRWVLFIALRTDMLRLPRSSVLVRLVLELQAYDKYRL